MRMISTHLGDEKRTPVSEIKESYQDEISTAMYISFLTNGIAPTTLVLDVDDEDYTVEIDVEDWEPELNIKLHYLEENMDNDWWDMMEAEWMVDRAHAISILRGIDYE